MGAIRNIGALAGFPGALGRVARVHSKPVVIPAVVALALVLLVEAPVRAGGHDTALSGLQPYLVQMHIHGHSNHNGNSLPASMESQCSEAAKNGFDVVWWTDHAVLFEGFDEDIVVDFDDAVFDAESTTVVFRRSRARDLTRIDIDGSLDDSHCDVIDNSLRVRVESPPGARKASKVSLALTSERGRVNLVNLCRPVTSGLEFKTWGRLRGLGDDTLVRIKFDFSWHPAGQHHAIFDLVRGAGGGRRSIGDTTVVEEIGIQDGALDLVLDLEEALAILPNGDDNTFSSCKIEVGARNGASLEVMIDSLKIVSTKPDGRTQFDTLKKFSQRYRYSLGIIQYVGVEVGLLHLPRIPHMSAFLPDCFSTYENMRLQRGFRLDEWVMAIQELGGLVAVDHPFGAALRLQYTEGYEVHQGLTRRELSQEQGLVEESYFRQVAVPVVEEGAWGADLIEVGYLFRGAGSLRDHLRLWDLALANGVRLMGFGSSDSHGGVWGPDMEPNPFATWVWSVGETSENLIDAMRSGSMVFGDPFLWKSSLAFGVGEALMGDTLFVDKRQEVRGWLYMEPWRSDIQVRLVQVETGKSDQRDVIRSDIIEDIRDGFSIEADRPSFARIEVYDTRGVPLAFTNPVFLIPR
jgi:hypothetical protein